MTVSSIPLAYKFWEVTFTESLVCFLLCLVWFGFVFYCCCWYNWNRSLQMHADGLERATNHVDLLWQISGLSKVLTGGSERKKLRWKSLDHKQHCINTPVLLTTTGSATRKPLEKHKHYFNRWCDKAWCKSFQLHFAQGLWKQPPFTAKPEFRGVHPKTPQPCQKSNSSKHKNNQWLRIPSSKYGSI